MQRMLRLFLVFLFFVLTTLPVFAEPVDINQADAATLSSSLKGVGVKKARSAPLFNCKFTKKAWIFVLENDSARVWLQSDIL